MCLIYNNSRQAFYKYIYQRRGEGKLTVSLGQSGAALTNQEAPEILLKKFSSNFSAGYKSTMTASLSLADKTDAWLS